jgi:hypothetical protein
MLLLGKEQEKIKMNLEIVLLGFTGRTPSESVSGPQTIFEVIYSFYCISTTLPITQAIKYTCKMAG